ncbi:MAG: hypothetical protein ACRDHL_11365, partial [Candidatus Promineifilaceae bacterium]
LIPAALAGLLALALGLRLLAARDLAFPAWVDASRHALITTVMGQTGRAMRDYSPFLPVERFPYHSGYHALAAGVALLDGAVSPAGATPALPGLLLSSGQLLNALAPLAVYAGASLMTGRRGAALLAAFLVAAPFYFPGYYATWSRYTQLAAVLILPAALGLTWRLLHGARAWRRAWPLLALLAAGLFLTHFRVFLLYLPFAALAWLLARGRNGRRLALAAAGAALLAGPQVLQLAADARGMALGRPIEGYNDFPTAYFEVGLERIYLGLAAAGLLWALVRFGRRRPGAAAPVCLGLWVGAAGLLLAGRRLGLPESWLINLNSAAIVLFVPLALLLGWAGGRLG